MRSVCFVVLVIGALTLWPACGGNDCSDSATCADARLPPRAEAEGGAPTEAGASADAESTVFPAVAPPAGCNPVADPNDNGACADDTYALFVDPQKGDDRNPGTKASPLRSLVVATRNDVLVGRQRIYVCVGPAQSQDALTLPPNVSLIGGVACDTWRHVDGQVSTIAPIVPGVVIRTRGPGDVVLADLAIVARDAVASGESSVAVFLGSSTASLYRVTVEAGAGARGGRPVSVTNQPPAVPPKEGTGLGGGAETVRKCNIAGQTIGGKGGSKLANGEAGRATPVATPSSGRMSEGGKGGIACSPGGNGADGAATMSGVPSPVAGVLTVDGWKAGDGGSGLPGEPGAGGGGGGGDSGSGGGAGGAGGCGGNGGLGGGGGGASIGIASVETEVTLHACTITTKGGGDGENGGDGEPGGPGQSGAPGACGGGTGGNGAGGSGGAGGAGGLSLPFARVAGVLKRFDGTKAIRGAHGKGGKGGNSGPAAQNSLGTGKVGNVGGPGLTPTITDDELRFDP